jgi:protoporphyrinogen oxidase
VDSERREVLLADGRRVRYGRLISTIPLPALARLLGETVPPTIRECAAALKHNSVHAVNIGLDGTDLAAAEAMHWIFFPEESTIFHRLSFPGNLSGWMVPRGCTSIQAEISESSYRPCDRAALIQQTLEHLARVGILKATDVRPLAEGGRVRLAQVVTLDPAYVIYDLRHRENTRTIRDHLRSLGISTRGRFGEWEYLNMDHVILSGKAAAEEAAQ